MACATFFPFFFNLSFQRQKTHFHSLSSTHLHLLSSLSVSTPIFRYPRLYPLTTSTALERLPSSTFTFPHFLCASLSSTPIHSPTSTSQHHDNEHNTEAQQHLIIQFLLNECGLCPSEVTKVVRTRASLLRIKSIQTAKEAVQLLRNSGFTETQLKKTILKNPSFLALKVDRQLKPKIEFMKTLGLTHQDLGNTISKAPRLLNLSLDKNLRAQILHFENLFGSKASLCKAILVAPDLLYLDVEKHLKPKLDLLKQCGIQGELLSHLISKYPAILSSNSVESLQLRIEYVKNLDILEGSKTFTYALCTVIKNGPKNFDKKLKDMRTLGLSKDDIHKLIKKAPRVLTLSTNKMQKNMDFLKHSGLQPTIVVMYPALLAYSLEKRLKPRHAVFEAICSMQQSKPLPSLVTMFCVSEQTFLKKFVESSPQVAVLSKVYEGSPVSLQLPKGSSINHGGLRKIVSQSAFWWLDW